MKVARNATCSLAVEDAERFGELRAIVGDPREVGIGELLVRRAPGEVDVGGVGRGADQHRVAVGEILRELAIADDLGRADEGEILRPVEQDLPLAVGLGEVDRLACGQRGHALLDGKNEFGKLVANGKHASSSPVFVHCVKRIVQLHIGAGTHRSN